MYLLFLLLDFRGLLTFSYYLFAGCFILIIINQFKQLRKSEKYDKPKISIKDAFNLSFKYLKINRIYVVASVIGLILATVVISQTLLMATSYQQDAFNRYIEDDSDTEALQVNIWGVQDLDSYMEFQDELQGKVEQLFDKYDFELLEIKSETRFSFEVITGEEVVEPEGFRYIPTEYFESFTWTREVYDALYKLPTFDKSIRFNPHDTIVILNSWTENSIDDVQNNNSIRIIAGSSYKDSMDNSSFASHTVRITNIWKPTSIDVDYINNNDLWEILNMWTNILYTDVDMQFTLYENLTTLSQQQGYEYFGEMRSNFKIYMNLPNLVDVGLNEFTSKLGKLNNELQSWGYSYYSSNIYMEVFSPLRNSIKNYQSISVIFRIILLVVSAPLIGLALFLVYFSLTLVEQRKSRLIAIMKIRGTSKGQLQSMLISEVMLGSISATIVGMVLSIPWTLLSLRSSGILEFNDPGIPLEIPSMWYWKIPLIGIILAINLNIASILSLSKTIIDEAEDTIEQKEPFWQRYYLDLIMFAVSTIYWVFLRVFPIEGSFFELLLFGLGPIMLLVTLVSLPLVVARYFGEFIGIGSDFLWKIQGGLLALATRNMRKNRFSASRLAALLMMGMMLSFFSVIVPTTFLEWGREDAQYDLGADIYIQGIDSENSTQWDLLDVDGIKSVSEIEKLSISSYSDQTRGGVSYYQFLGINTSTFAKTAFWKKNYDKDSLSSITNRITANTTVGIQSKQVEAMGLKIGDKFSVNLGGNSQKEITLEITTDFDYFPNLVNYIPVKYEYGYSIWEATILTNISLIRSMMDYNEDLQSEKGAYVSVENDADVTKVKENLQKRFEDANMTSIGVVSYKDVWTDFSEADETKLIISTLQGMLVITILVSAISVGYFSFITLAERNREIGTFRAIGMIKKQIFVLLVIEGLILLFSGILLGGISGWFLSSNFFFMITSENQGGSVPPTRMIMPWDIILIFSAVLIVLTILAAAIPAQITASKQTGNILRSE